MTAQTPMNDRALGHLAAHLRPDLSAEEGSRAILWMAQGVAADLDAEETRKRADALAAAREEGTRDEARERLASFLARAVLIHAVRDATGEVPDHARAWISANVTSATRHAPRVDAILREAAGLAREGDREIFDHALKSALAGETVEPVPGSAPSETPQPGTEDTMLDPTDLRNRILDKLAVNPAGLPDRLRTERGQQVYLDAVIQGVLRQQHFSRGDDDAALLWSTAAAGLMLADAHYNPADQRFYAHLQRTIVELAGSADEQGQVQIDGHDLKMFAPDDATQRINLFGRTFEILNAQMGEGNKVFLQSFARVARSVADRYEDHKGNGPVMAAMVTTSYAKDVTEGGAGGGGGGGGIANVDLPPLNDPQGYNDEIEPDNVRAVSTIYVTYQLEFALKAMSRILELFVAGLLPIAASDGSARELDDLYWDQDDLLDEASRRSVYSRVLGAPGGEIAFDIQPNTEFNTLLMRVVSSVSEYEREQSALTHFDNASRGRRFQATSGEFVRKSIRDFAANASLRGWAGTAFTAERMARHVKKAFRILGLPAVKNAFGVSTPWQVIERVSQREFGVTVNTVLHRTLASETQTIMRIIADNHTVWSSSGRPLFPEMGQRVPDMLDLMRKAAEAQGGGGDGALVLEALDLNGAGSDLSVKAARELLVACQHFRAVTGVGDALLEEYSAPVEVAAVPSLPNLSGFSGGAPMPDMGGISQLREMVASGQAPSLDQLRAMLPGF